MSTLDPDTGSRCEFKTYHTVPKKDGKLATETLIEPFGKVRVTDDDAPYALVVKRTFTKKYDLKSVTLTVNSAHILRAFRDVIGDKYPAVAADFTTPFTLQSPFQMFMHYWDKLEQHRKETTDNSVRQHLNLLLEFMRNEIGADRDTVMTMIQKNQITYSRAWVLFRPGDLQYTTVMGHPWLLRCDKTAYETSTTAGPYMEVHCTYTDHDGKLAGQASHVIRIYQKRSFGGENPAFITDLPIYPRRFVKGADDLEATLEIRGRKFLDHRGVSVEAYDGLAQFLKEPPYSFYHPEMADFESVWLPFSETGRIVLDRKSFQEDQYSSGVEVKVAEQEPLLCPPYALGYSLSRKDWCRFFVDGIRKIEWEHDIWDSLILNEEEKLVLQALVTCHHFPENARDQPEQKGKGLVILLHGTPGSGKTLTAETAAEGSQKALISTSLAELNKDRSPWMFEYNLKRILQYATLWKAIVLLDEADVFLEARNPTADGSSNRNSLVAIFLKELEYFSGIVFLTTNRLASLDPAMKSRIHLALGYAPPDLDSRRRIWTRYLSSVPEDETDIDDVDDTVDFLVREKLNGREISNAVNTARTIARFRKEKLQLAHVESVLRVRHEFDRSLRDEARRLTSSATGSGGLLKRDSIVTAEPEYKS